MTPEEEREVLNLLAVIHRDGGHHTERHGVLQSIRDAMARIPEERAAYEEAIRSAEENARRRKLDRLLGSGQPDVVHILSQGFPLCGFSEKLPAEWPSGHRWVSFVDWDEATCADCRMRGPDASDDLGVTRRAQ